jgi:hypothetical protein
VSKTVSPSSFDLKYLPNMFGTTPATAWELEAERRVELAYRARPASGSEAFAGRQRGLLASLRRLTGSLRQAAPAGLKDLRT